MNRKIAIGITGASGAIYAKQLLDFFTDKKEYQIAVVMSDNAKVVWKEELGNENFHSYPFTFYEKTNFYSPLASGSSDFDTLIIAPCSMGTLGRIASGISNDLITRAADVMLKERRKLIVLLRETPFNLVHIRNMEQLAEAGAIVCPASPSFYSNPQTIEELSLTVSNRVLTLAGIDTNSYKWGT